MPATARAAACCMPTSFFTSYRLTGTRKGTEGPSVRGILSACEYLACHLNETYDSQRPCRVKLSCMCDIWWEASATRAAIQQVCVIVHVGASLHLTEQNTNPLNCILLATVGPTRCSRKECGPSSHMACAAHSRWVWVAPSEAPLLLLCSLSIVCMVCRGLHRQQVPADRW